MLAPDAAYVTPEKLKGLSKEDLTRLPRFCPDFVIELFSPSDRFKPTKAKMEQWIGNVVSLGWLIDPSRRRVLIYQSACDPMTVSADFIDGVVPVSGFRLDLNGVLALLRNLETQVQPVSFP